MTLADLEAFERLLEMQLKTDNSPSIRKKLAAVRVNIADAQGRAVRQQILETLQ